MSDQQPEMSDPFEVFRHEAPGHARAWMGAVRALDEASALERKTEELASLAVAAALRLEGEVPMQVQ
jgi:alkylhydroperoxidase/carboxymuconolactone decarboxylase family protein YurZ